jgi:cupin 2 domain-containing protein
MKKSNIFSQIPSELKDELFEEIVSKDSLKIERIISKGHTTAEGEWYNQESDEWVIVLSGEAILEFENSHDVKLKEGDYLNIPAHTKHRVSWTKANVETVWLAIHY